MRISVIGKELGDEPLLLHLEKSQFSWPWHLVGIFPRRGSGEVLRAHPCSRKAQRPRRHLKKYISWLAWERLEREVWASLLKLVPDPSSNKW